MQENNKKVAAQLKGKIHAPTWAEFVKTGNHKQRQPESKDWWYERAASILQKVKDKGPVGTNKLRTAYGGKKNRGVKPEKFKVAGGNHIRKILQQLESAGFLKQKEVDGHKGRVITKQGLEVLKHGNIQTRKQEKKTE